MTALNRVSNLRNRLGCFYPLVDNAMSYKNKKKKSSMFQCAPVDPTQLELCKSSLCFETSYIEEKYLRKD